jgi:hypothetical protein
VKYRKSVFENWIHLCKIVIAQNGEYITTD